MACGSVVHKEGRLNREIGSNKLGLQAEKGSNFKPGRSKFSKNPFDRGDVHEAVKFLQEEHEKVLSGLHQQIDALQRTCDDFHFDTHLRPVLSDNEEILEQRFKETLKKLEEKSKRTMELEKEMEQGRELLEEERQQNRWKEIQLQQQIEVYEQRSTEAKAEIQRLKAQVHDLQVYCSGIRASEVRLASRRQSVDQNTAGSPRSMVVSNGVLRSSQESLDSLDLRSIGSEDGDSGAWREARLGWSMNGRFIPSRASRAMSSPSYSIGGRNLKNSQTSQTISLPPVTPITDSLSRPSSGAVMLPPISQTQAITRPQVRRQLRLFSAPNFDSSMKSKTSKQPP